ncbi:MAG: hypothetical protein QOH04_1803 [Sphingomonadales bacterium]|jgi:hypothetical protein|nr:hypothetical protein [Sphingomonadales bacterium]MEA3036038.1 hypothetical protein [Sphingomonadales bacterium]
MRYATILLIPLLAACGARGAANAETDAQNDLLANLQLVDSNADPARLQALIDETMPAVLADAKDAQYRNVRAGAGGAVCGEVSSAKQPFLPFVITPAKIALVGSSPQIQFADPSDLLADAYVRWCATPEELSRIGPQLHQAASDPANITMSQVTAATPPPPPPEAADAPPAAPPPAPKATPARPAPPQDIDSFMNSVAHKQP